MFKLVREAVGVNDAISKQHGWPVRITATFADDMPASIFVYHTAAGPLEGRDFFSCVASATQMTELPESSGGPGLPFYRVHQMLLICRSAKHADELFTKVRSEVQSLADNLHLVNALAVVDSSTIVPNPAALY